MHPSTTAPLRAIATASNHLHAPTESVGCSHPPLERFAGLNRGGEGTGRSCKRSGSGGPDPSRDLLERDRRAVDARRVRRCSAEQLARRAWSSSAGRQASEDRAPATVLRRPPGRCTRPLGRLRRTAHSPPARALSRHRRKHRRRAGGAVEADAGASTLAAALMRELRTRSPTILVLEDVHWADDATLDCCGCWPGGSKSLPAALLVSYRQTELSRFHPLRQVLGEFGSAAVERAAEARAALPGRGRAPRRAARRRRGRPARANRRQSVLRHRGARGRRGNPRDGP